MQKRLLPCTFLATAAFLSGVPAHSSPNSADLLLRSSLEEPLVPSARTSPAEDEALLDALQAYRRQSAPDDFRALENFLSAYPRSGWRVALLTNLGLANYHYGYFSRAIDAFEQAWKEGRQVTGPAAKALVDRAVAELARMHARLGHADRLETLFREIGARPITGSATEYLQGAREGLWLMRNEPGRAYLCGPMALKNLLLAQGAPYERVSFLDDVRSGPRGVSLAEVAQLAAKAKLPYRLIFRQAGQPVPVPSIVHWKVTHFAAVVAEEDGRFHIQDPTFGQDLWMPRAALESESSGYFLVPDEQPVAVWRPVDRSEASRVRGMGQTGNNETGACTDNDGKTKPNNNNCAMCGYNMHEMLVSVNLKDTPIGYTPPRGPAIYITVTYNQREAGQPANFAWSNLSPKWTMNWLAYIEDDPRNSRANVTRFAGGGGNILYTGFNTTTNAYVRETRDGSLLARIGDGAYDRQLSDGGHEIYSTSNGATTNPRRVFLTQIIDPAGNAVRLNYDNQFRLISILDNAGRATVFAYEQPGRALLVTKITDPFGRIARIGYDSTGRLNQLTDVLGMVSQFTYDSAGLVNSMTTPYGTSTFAYGQTGTTRFVEATDALGFKERLEFKHAAAGVAAADSAATLPKGIPQLQDAYLEYRNTFYWDKHLFAIAAGDYAKARRRHWVHLATDTNVTGHSLESVKNPLENRVWLSYPGQSSTLFSGKLDRSDHVGRVLDDGTTQLSQTTYNTLGNPTDIVDAVGRETQLVYDTNGTDLLQVKQKTSATGFSTLAEFTYNSQHKLLTRKDAAGQVTSYAYNSAGQITQITDPLRQITRYEYDTFGYLTRIVNPSGATAATFTYDKNGRIASRTDSENYTVSFTYDAMDRPVSVLYGDGTTREYTWDKLDLVAVKDRQGRISRYTYDAVRNLTQIIDPLGRKTTLSYYENGLLKSITDANGNTTSWDIDLQNRVTAKHFADGTKITYTYENSTSRLKSVTDALGQKKQFTYTADDRLAGIDYVGTVNPTPNVRFRYDAFFPRMISMTDGLGTTQYQYYPAGSPGALRLQQEDGPFGNDTVSYQYDALGRMIARTVDSVAETFTYDRLGRLLSHESPLGAFDFGYLGESRQRTRRRLRGGTPGTDWTYDANTNARRLLTIANGGSARGYSFVSTPEDLVTRILEKGTDDGSGALPAQTWDYTYDDADRLLQAVGSAGPQYGYSYDPVNSINSWQTPDTAISATYDVVDRVVTLNDKTYTYDANGNLLDDGTKTYQWDAENRLIGITRSAEPDKTTLFRYDGVGRLLAIVSPDGQETRYLWCGRRICQSRSAADAPLRRYYPEGEADSSGTSLYYASDQLGSVRDVVGADGSNLASFDYDPYGRPTQSAGSASTDFRFAGMFYDSNSGLYLTRNRMYDAVASRWLSRDPSSQTNGFNLYAYVAANPVKFTDRSGLTATCPDSPPANDPAWAPYATRWYQSNVWFHCGFYTVLENRVPTPDDPIGECVYDDNNKLVDENHPYCGCRGTPDQYSGATDPWNHFWNDSGGIWQAGWPAFTTSRQRDWDRLRAGVNGLIGSAENLYDQAQQVVGQVAQLYQDLQYAAGVASRAVDVINSIVGIR